MLKYVGCPLTYALKMQTEMALRITEAKFIELSEGMQTIILIMNLMEEIQEQGVSMMNSKAEINCQVFEDTSGAFTIATFPKIRPRTKYINAEHLEQVKVT